MDKIVEIKKFITNKASSKEKQSSQKPETTEHKSTNPIKNSDNTILKNLAKFTNTDIKKFDLNDLLR